MVHRSIGTEDLESLDPFLTFDEFRMYPETSKTTSSRGFPDHPHRGFETVTLMLKGHFQHEDFTGHKGTIGPGDVQWMTAGRGIVHAEMPLFLDEEQTDTNEDRDAWQDGSVQGKEKQSSNNTRGKGSRAKNRKGSKEIWGLQLWVNLPKAHKLCKPQYQEFKDESISRWSDHSIADDDGGRADHPDPDILSSIQDMSLQDVDEPLSLSPEPVQHTRTSNPIEVKVIAGESHGVSSKVYTRTPTQYLEIRMTSRQSFTEWIPETYAGFVYILEGRGYFGDESIEGAPQQMLILSTPVSGNCKVAESGTPSRTNNVFESISNQPLEPTSLDSLPSKSLPKSYIRISTREEPLHLVLIAGEPCREPVFRQGPFVMNSKEELQRTFRDYEEKKRGFEKAKGWVSTIGRKGPPITASQVATNRQKKAGKRARKENDDLNREHDDTRRQKG
ncbi:hypothetical protein BGX28_001513 [Mortierella sp. GBA30]|nr:hypothetical protein BGX28_001513 [Mortierella sp. GBA30]